jgi:hypothetical protein
LFFKYIPHLSFLRHAVCLYLFLTPISELKAQKVFSTYPFQFDQIFVHYNTINPAAVLPDRKQFVQAGYNGFSKVSNNLATYYLNFRTEFGGDTAVKAHKLGLFVTNDKEGIYLNRARLMGQYAFSVRLSHQIEWTTGMSLGFVNNALKSNTVIGGESVFSSDGDMGTWIRYNDIFYGGISLNQIFNNTVSFLNGNYTRKRYGTLILGYKKIIGPFFYVKTEMFARTGWELYNKYVLGLTLVYNEKLTAGLIGKSGNGLIPTFGIREISFIKDNKLAFLVSFRIPTSRFVLPGTGNSEIMVEYKF